MENGFLDVYRVSDRAANGYLAFTYSYEGQIVVKRSRVGIYDVCRAMLKLGHKGRLREIDHKTGMVIMTCDIEKGAKLTVSENEDGLRVKAYEKFPEHLKRPGMGKGAASDAG